MNIVFDFGAVLFTWEPVDLVARSFPARTSTAQHARELAHQIFHHPDWQDFDSGRMELKMVIAKTAKRLQLDTADVQALMEPIGEQLLPIASSVHLLAQLRDRRQLHQDIRLYFLSNMPVPYARALERRHRFLQWFDGGLFSGDVKMGKPDPAIFNLLAARYALNPADTMFIDDMQVNVEAAAAMGWQTILHQHPDRLAEEVFKRILPVAHV